LKKKEIVAMQKRYQAVLAGVGTGQIDVAFPDFPGCVTVAETVDDALVRAEEVLLFHVRAMVDDGDPLPTGTDETALVDMVKEYVDDGYQTLVTAVAVDIPTGKAKRINVELPEYVLDAADRWARKHGENRSKLLASAAMDYMTRHP
jgi:predicted RNase H-like HicB family nuclease